MVQQAELTWNKGEDLLRCYKVPEAERFYTQFCSQCGSPMPRDVPAIGAVVVPAGSLDQEIDLMPEARIFCDSRAEWSCGGDGLPVFAAYPPDRQ
jgi:hypothetical protein